MARWLGLDGVLSLSDKHKFELLDTGVVVSVSGHKVSVSHDQSAGVDIGADDDQNAATDAEISAVEDIIGGGGVVLVQDVLDVVHGYLRS